MLWQRCIDAVNMAYQIVSYLTAVRVVYLVYRIYGMTRIRVWHLWKNLLLSYKTDLDLRDCLGRVNGYYSKIT